ncbi:hypothetical protein KEM48_001692 [Puccinia striiformis f. sp. tritici PST-130]|nr:hypothetical protein KEM48_001692 [Puccinia striiformis f. sp. tritici PST-130]
MDIRHLPCGLGDSAAHTASFRSTVTSSAINLCLFIMLGSWDCLTGLYLATQADPFHHLLESFANQPPHRFPLLVIKRRPKNKMPSLYQSLLICTLMTSAWVHSVMIEVMHHNQPYWICSIDHEFTGRENAPIRLVGPIKTRENGFPNDHGRSRGIVNLSSTEQVWVTNGCGNGATNKILSAGESCDRYTFRSSSQRMEGPLEDDDLGYFIVLTKADPAAHHGVWSYLLRQHADRIRQAVNGEKNI